MQHWVLQGVRKRSKYVRTVFGLRVPRRPNKARPNPNLTQSPGLHVNAYGGSVSLRDSWPLDHASPKGFCTIYRRVLFTQWRGRAGHNITLLLVFYLIFTHCQMVFLQQLYCFQYNIAVGTTSSGKRQIFISRTIPFKSLQSVLEESLHWPQSLFKFK